MEVCENHKHPKKCLPGKIHFLLQPNHGERRFGDSESRLRFMDRWLTVYLTASIQHIRLPGTFLPFDIVRTPEVSSCRITLQKN